MLHHNKNLQPDPKTNWKKGTSFIDEVTYMRKATSAQK